MFLVSNKASRRWSSPCLSFYYYKHSLILISNGGTGLVGRSELLKSLVELKLAPLCTISWWLEAKLGNGAMMFNQKCIEWSSEMLNFRLDFMSLNYKSKIINLSDKLRYMKESVRYPSGLQNFLRVPHTKLTTITFLDPHHTGRRNMDKAARIYTERSIDGGNIFENDQNMRSGCDRYINWFHFSLFLFNTRRSDDNCFQICVVLLISCNCSPSFMFSFMVPYSSMLHVHSFSYLIFTVTVSFFLP